MSILLITEKLWRFKLVTLPIIALTLAGAFYVAAVKPAVYQTSSSYILVNPPAPPTADQVAQNPKLAQGSSNPYTRYSDQSIIVQILSARLNSDAERAKLYKEGVDPRYVVAPDVSFGFTAPVLQITGLGLTPEAATKATSVVGKALTDELARMQEIHGVAATYRIDVQQIVAAEHPQLKASGKLRSLVAVMGLGGVMLFLAISIIDAFSTLRARRAHPHAEDGGVGLKLANGWTPPPPDISGPRPVPVEPAVPAPPPRRSGPSAWDAPTSSEPTAFRGRAGRGFGRAQGGTRNE